MAYKLIDEQIADDTADRIMAKAGLERIKPRQFPDTVQRLDTMRKMTSIPNALHNGYLGVRVATVAESYIASRMLQGEYWNYNANGGILDFYDEDAHNKELEHIEEARSQSDESEESDNEDTPRDQALFNGYDPMAVRNVYRLYAYATKPYSKAAKEPKPNIGAAIDCSTFVSLALRGIDYNHSPWALYGVNGSVSHGFTWNPVLMGTMIQHEGWENRAIDFQPNGVFANLGFVGHSSLRTAADFGEFFYKTGKILYDRQIYSVEERAINQPKTADILPLLEPGDILFFSGRYFDDDGGEHLTIRNRFRCISHIAIASRNVEKIMEVTNGKVNTYPNAVYYRTLTDAKLAGLTLVIRPDYRPHVGESYTVGTETPVGANQLYYPWTFSRRKTYETGGITVESMGENVLKLTGTTTSEVNITLAGSTSNPDAGMWLSAGTYVVEGMDATKVQSIGFAVQVKQDASTEFSPRCRGYYNSTENTFTLSQDSRVYVRLHIASGMTTNCTISPTIKRVEE